MNYVLEVIHIGVLCVVALALFRVGDALFDLKPTLDAIRKSGRTTQRRAVMRDTPLSEERVGERLKQAGVDRELIDTITHTPRQQKTRSRVVGGDPNSSLNQSLSRGVPNDDDDE